MTRHDFSRYAAVSRRTALSGALGAALFAVAACNNDDSALSGASPRTDGSSTAPGTDGSSSEPSASNTPTASDSASTKPGKPLPTSATLSVAFTFAVTDGGGRVRNPYIAVWIEDSAGDLVKTVALWHEDRGGEDRWLSEMKAFSALGVTDAQTVSSATRQPGAYTVQWDGSTGQGGRASAGTYRLFIEAAREHGPYELIQQDVNLGTKAASFTLTPSGELTAASAEYAV